jgi:cob(I)alamin adenosyltransferase
MSDKKVTTGPKIYTKKGDKGMTSLYNGERVKKNHYIIHTLGKVDELNVRIGGIKIYLDLSLFGYQKIKYDLETIQHTTMFMNSWIAHPNPTEAQLKRLPEIKEDWDKILEDSSDEYQGNLPPLKNFVLPGHNDLCVAAHAARAQTRECERFISDLDYVNPSIKQYFNRLSDYFFALSRWFSRGNDVIHKKE